MAKNSIIIYHGTYISYKGLKKLITRDIINPEFFEFDEEEYESIMEEEEDNPDEYDYEEVRDTHKQNKQDADEFNNWVFTEIITLKNLADDISRLTAQINSPSLSENHKYKSCLSQIYELFTNSNHNNNDITIKFLEPEKERCFIGCNNDSIYKLDSPENIEICGSACEEDIDLKLEGIKHSITYIIKKC